MLGKYQQFEIIASHCTTVVHTHFISPFYPIGTFYNYNITVINCDCFITNTISLLSLLAYTSSKFIK